MSRRKFTSKFKTKVALEALKEQKTLSELARQFDLHPQQIRKWKREFLEGAESIFENKQKSMKTEAEQKNDALLRIIGEQKVALDFLKNALR